MGFWFGDQYLWKRYLLEKIGGSIDAMPRDDRLALMGALEELLDEIRLLDAAWTTSLKR